MDDPAPSASQQWQLRWPIALLLNLILPILLAWDLTARSGRIGMAAGIGLIWYLGHRLCAVGARMGRALVVGGFVVALSQICPVLQMASGVLGIAIASAVGQGYLPYVDDLASPGVSELGGLIATLTTGAVLILTAIGFGAFITMSRQPRPVARPAPGALLYDRQMDG